MFVFDESVEASFGALRVFDATGKEVQTGDAFHPGNQGEQIAVKLRSGLGDGTYTATYRVVSADGHAISSGYVFTVGEGAAPERLARPVARRRRDRPGHQHGAGRRPRRPVRRDRPRPRRADLLPRLLAPHAGHVASVHRPLERILLVAAIAGFVSAAVAVILQGAVGQGGVVLGCRPPRRRARGARHPLRPRVGHRRRCLARRARRAGPAPAAPAGPRQRRRPTRAGPLVLAGGGSDSAPPPRPCASPLAPPLRRSPPRVSPRWRPLFALTLLPSLGGHTSVQQPVGILMPANVAHVLAMSAWLGGIAVLVLALRSATAGLAPEARTPLLADVVGRFSRARRARARRPAGDRRDPGHHRGRELPRAARHAVRPLRADQGRRGDRDRRPRRATTARSCCPRCAAPAVPRAAPACCCAGSSASNSSSA